MNEQTTLEHSNHNLGEGGPAAAPHDAIADDAAPAHAHWPAAEAAAGAAAGAVAGAVAGPPGMAIGAILGGFVGAAAGVALGQSSQEKSRHDEQLDHDIGVSGGDIGAASPNQPPSHGRFHAAALGVSDGEAESSDGAIQNVDG